MKLFLLLMIVYVACFVQTLPIISKPLEKNPDHLVWEALLTIDTHRSDDKTRKIPKSIFITPILGNCPPDHKLGSDGKCYKTLKIDPVDLLKSQIAFLFKKNKTATTEYVEDYDYSEYGESTESIQSGANSGYTLPLSLSFPSEDPSPPPSSTAQHTTTTFTHLNQLNRVVKDGTHGVNNNHTNASKQNVKHSSTTTTASINGNVNNESANKPFLGSTVGSDLDSEGSTGEFEAKRIHVSSSTPVTISTIPSEVTKEATAAATVVDDVTEMLELDFGLKETAADEAEQVATEGTSSQSEFSTIDDRDTFRVMDRIESIDTIHLPLIGTTEDSTEISSSSPATTKPSTLTTLALPTAMPSTNSDDSVPSTSSIPTIAATGPVTERHESTVFTTSSTTTDVTSRDHSITTIATTLPTTTTIASKAASTTSETQASYSPSTTLKSSIIDAAFTDSTSNAPTASSIAAEPSPEEIVIEDDEPKFPVLSQIGEIDKILMDLSDNASKVFASFEHIDKDAMAKQQDDDDVTEVNEESPLTQLSSDPIVVLAEHIRTDQAEAADNSPETIDAYYIPSPTRQGVDRIDRVAPVEQQPTSFAVDGKYRLDNVSVVMDDEWPSDAPHMPDNADAQSNVELIDPISSEHPLDSDEYTKNLTARLAEDLLIRSPTMELGSLYDLTKLANTTGGRQPTNDGDSAVPLELDEAIPYPFTGSEEVTTIDPVEQSSDIIIVRSKSATNGGRSTNVTLAELKNAVRMGTDSTGQPAQRVNSKASVYTTFINRLKPMAPSFGELQLPDVVRRHTFAPPTTPESTVRSHSAMVQTQADDAVDETTADQFMTGEPPEDDPAVIAEHPQIDGKPSQLGINCYLRPLINKQYFMFCK